MQRPIDRQPREGDPLSTNDRAGASPEFVQLYDADRGALRDELVAGLMAEVPAVSPKFFYDTLGSKLFEAITALDEYYPTRTEAAIFAQHRHDIAAAAGEGLTLIDLGAGNCAKAAALFDVLRPRRYVAVDISVEFLRDALDDLQRRHPRLPMLGVGDDFSARLRLPPQAGDGPRLMFYPGSSIGNFTAAAASSLLRNMREASNGGALLIGVDLLKPPAVLKAAYDDALGVTAAFNLNLLRNVNRLLGSDFDVRQWRHRASFDEHNGRVEMHLQAEADLVVTWPHGQRAFTAGQRLHTENSCKYSVDGFERLLQQAGCGEIRRWSDAAGWFAVFMAR